MSAYWKKWSNCKYTIYKWEKIDAYSQIENINDKIIAVIILGDDKENAFRRNFSAAHELGHLLLDDFYDIEGMSKVEYKEMEDTMNRLREHYWYRRKFTGLIYRQMQKQKLIFIFK